MERPSNETLEQYVIDHDIKPLGPAELKVKMVHGGAVLEVDRKYYDLDVILRWIEADERAKKIDAAITRHNWDFPVASIIDDEEII